MKEQADGLAQANAAANAEFTQNLLLPKTAFELEYKMENQRYPAAERILGVYPQRQTGLFMQRIKVFGGRISWNQWRKVIEITGRYSKRRAIHITTRQDIELHDIAGADLKAVQDELTDTGLNIYGACGDCVRNITVCTVCDFNNASLHVFNTAKLVFENLRHYPCYLPRKFKISFSGCSRNCAKPWLSDLGFVLDNDGRFSVIGAGSLGPKPAAGILLYKALAPQEVLPLCLAALQFFKETGDYHNKNKARLRHVREKLGDNRFKEELDTRLQILLRSRGWPDVPLTETRADLKLLYRLQLPNGNIDLNEAIQLADAAQPVGAELRINLEHGLEIFGSQLFQLPANLAGLKNLPVIIACPGLSSCAKAITDTWTAADAIRQRIRNIDSKKARICISGCPNSCAHSAVADIGLIGLMKNLNGKTVECFRILTGGHNGTDDRLAVVGEVVAASDVPIVVENLLLSDNRQTPVR